MRIEFTRQFEKQVEQLKDEKLKNEIATVVKSVITAKSLSEIPIIAPKT